MIRCVFAAFLLAWLNLPAAAATRLDATAINNADYRAKPSSKNRIDPSKEKPAMRANVALPRNAKPSTQDTAMQA